MSLIDDIKHDLEEGTPGKFIADFDGEDDFDGVPIMSEHRGGSFVAIANCPVDYTDREQRVADTRRLSRVPDMEAALLAAEDHLVAALEAISEGYARSDISHEDFMVKAAHFADDALSAYREATK